MKPKDSDSCFFCSRRGQFNELISYMNDAHPFGDITDPTLSTLEVVREYDMLDVDGDFYRRWVFSSRKVRT